MREPAVFVNEALASRLGWSRGSYFRFFERPAHLREEYFVESLVPLAKDIGFENLSTQHQEKSRQLLVGRKNIDMFAIRPAYCGEVFVSVPFW